MSSSRQRISARDYKHGGGRREGFDISKYQQFGLGLAAGLLVAAGVFVFDRHAQPADAELVPTPQSAGKAVADTPDTEVEDPAAKFEFYDVLKDQVVVPERERDVRPDRPAVPVTQPGTYVLQVASFQNLADAERLRLKISRLGIDATLQRVAIDDDEWHRVRIGPTRDLAKLNEVRRQLNAGDMNGLLMRLGD